MKSNENYCSRACHKVLDVVKQSCTRLRRKEQYGSKLRLRVYVLKVEAGDLRSLFLGPPLNLNFSKVLSYHCSFYVQSLMFLVLLIYLKSTYSLDLIMSFSLFRLLHAYSDSEQHIITARHIPGKF